MQNSLNMKEQIFKTTNDWTPTILRILLGLVILPHGAQKLLGWFGGYGYSGTMNFFTDTMGLPWLIAFAVIILEFFGAIALITGFATRIMAASFFILALGIVFTSHFEYGFFMNWAGNQTGEGVEYFILWIGITIALILKGGGRYSFDRSLIINPSRGLAN